MKDFIKKMFSQNAKIKLIAVLALLIAVVAFIVICTVGKEEKVNTTYLIQKLEASSELTTAKLNYTGMSKYTDSGIPFINKSNFVMVYHATARIGLDISKVKITSDNISKTITIKIPKAEVLDVNVDLEDIEYFDEKFALFNVNEKEDGIKAVDLAEKEAKKEIQKMGVLEMADKQAETLIKGLIIGIIPDNYSIRITE